MRRPLKIAAIVVLWANLGWLAVLGLAVLIWAFER